MALTFDELYNQLMNKKPEMTEENSASPDVPDQELNDLSSKLDNAYQSQSALNQANMPSSEPSSPIEQPKVDEVKERSMSNVPQAKNYEELLQKAMEDRKNNNMVSNLAEAGSNIGYAIGRVQRPKEIGEFYNNLRKQNDQGVQNIKDVSDLDQQRLQRQNETLKNYLAGRNADVNSPMMKVNMDLAKKYGLNPNDLKGLAPDEVSHVLDKVGVYAQHHDVAESRKLAQEMMMKEKQDQMNIKRGEKMTAELDPDRSRTGNFGKAAAVVQSANKIDGLFQQFPDGNIPSTQTVELATSVAGLLTNGSPQSQKQIDELVPHSAKGDFNKIASWITNDPRGNDQKKFMNLLKETAHREKQIAAKQVNDIQDARLAQFRDLKSKDPEFYKEILNKSKERYSVEPESKKEYTQDVLDYAKSHNITPEQALQIKKQRTGM